MYYVYVIDIIKYLKIKFKTKYAFTDKKKGLTLE